MAYAVLLSWPLVAVMLFGALGREKGLIWSVILGYLLLPENIAFELPGLPDYGKGSAIALSVILAALCFGNKLSWPDLPLPTRPEKDRFGLILKGLLLLVILGAVMTVRNNGGALVDVERVRRGLVMWDLISSVSDTVIAVTPFILAWRWLTAPYHHQEVLRTLVIMGVIYSILALYEMRMSPQINRTVYGYFPHAWLQHVRGGQFRPVVFLQHGLWLALFLLMASFAAFGLFRALKEAPNRALYLLAGLWILAVLFLSPNLGAALLAVLFVPPLLLLSRRTQARVVTVVAVIFLAFPAVRQAGLVPLDGFLSVVEGISEDRAQSLKFRLDNEDDMLARAYEKPIFGWGGWGRWRVIDDRGRDTTVSDGLWIIILTTRGWVGYIAFFGFLTLPLVVLSRVSRSREVSQATVTLGMIMAANLVYLVPNSALSSVGWMLAGAVAGFLGTRAAKTTETPEDPAQTGRRTRYSRFGPDTAKVVSKSASARAAPRHTRFSRG